MKLKRFSILQTMNLYPKLLASLCLLLSFSFSKAQDSTAKKYPSLLWEITGPNMDKPSYLFGTMHVSSKLVFHLSDSFFMALKNVEAVALESRPDEWLIKLSETMKNGANSSGQFGDYSNYGIWSLNEYSINKGELKEVLGSLSTDLNIINAFLYRSNGQMNQDFEERTYLDMFIYQSGMKLNKKLMSLEDYDQSMKLVNKAYQYEYGDYGDYDVYEPRPSSKSNSYYAYGEEDLMEVAYRTGDLDMLDSLELAQMSEKQYKYMLTERNILMADRADSIFKNHSLFIAVGAGHLAGKQGMIELLRSKGYTLRPVMQKGRDDKARRKLEKIQVKVEKKAFISSDSFIMADFPGNYIEYPDNGNVMIMSPDLVNGSHFTIYRNAYHSVFFDESPEFVLERIDSFLYESVRGDIISKKKIEVQGYPGYYILNKTRSGTYERSQLIVFPDEIILIKLGGSEKYVKGREGKGFFKSLKFRDLKGKPTAVKFKSCNLSMEFPYKPWSEASSIYNSDELYIGSSLKSENVFIAQNVTEQFNESFLPDTARLRFALTSFKYSDDFEEISSKYIEVLGKTAIEWNGKTKSGTPIKARAFWSGKSILIQSAIIHQESPEVERFFSSLAVYKNKEKSYQMIHDTLVCASYMALDTPVLSMEMYDPENYARWGIPSYRMNYVYDNDKRELLTISMSYPQRYSDPNDTADFTNNKYEYWHLDTSDLIIKSSEIRQEGNYLVKDRVIGDTACSFYTFTRTYWSPLRIYYVNYTIDSSKNQHSFFNKFLETFKPWDTVLYDNKYMNGQQAFWEDLQSDDTIITQKALNKIYSLNLADSLAYKLVQVLDTCDAHRKYRVKLRTQLAYLSDTAVLHYFTRKFLAVGDTTSMQMAALRTILEQKDTQSIRVAKKFLIKNTPLYSDATNETYLFSTLYDTLELAQLLLPEIVELTEYKEYESQVYWLLGKLADSGLVSPSKNPYKLDRLIREAKNELKRANSSGGSGNSYYSSYSDNDDEKSLSENLKRLLHALYPFRKVNEEVADVFKKAEQQDLAELKFELVRLQFAVDSSLNDKFLSEIAKSESNRFKLYEWLRDRNQVGRFPSAYLSNDSLIKPIIKANINNYSFNTDSIYMVGEDEIIIKQDTGKVVYFRIRSQYGSAWQYGCMLLLNKDSVYFSKDLMVNTNLGIWKESDDLNKKITKFSELIAIIKYKGIETSSGDDDYITEDLSMEDY